MNTKSLHSKTDPSFSASQIRTIRGQRVMLDADLAQLYAVQTKVLVQAVKRNVMRFPFDFMFQLSKDESLNLRSQFVTSSWGGRRTPPYAFTEQGVAMLSSVLSSPRAIAVNIEVMRAFVNLRAVATEYKDFAARLEEIEQKTESLSHKHVAFSNQTRQQLKEVFDALRSLMTPPMPPKRGIGFLADRD